MNVEITKRVEIRHEANPNLAAKIDDDGNLIIIDTDDDDKQIAVFAGEDAKAFLEAVLREFFA